MVSAVNCDDCRVDVIAINEASYMVTIPVWQAADGNRLLCIGCLERRLGRTLVPADFTHAPANRDDSCHSERLRDRLKGKAFLETWELPRALAIERFLDHLQISTQVTPVSIPAGIFEIAVRVRFRRDGNEATITLPFGWCRRSGAIEHVVLLQDFYRRIGDVAARGLRRHYQRQAGRAEAVLRTLFNPAELIRLRELLAVSTIE